MSAAGASIAMTAERCRAATDDTVDHLAVLRGEMRSMPYDEAAACYTEDVGHLTHRNWQHLRLPQQLQFWACTRGRCAVAGFSLSREDDLPLLIGSSVLDPQSECGYCL
jgi:hypothetical protein